MRDWEQHIIAQDLRNVLSWDEIQNLRAPRTKQTVREVTPNDSEMNDDRLLLHVTVNNRLSFLQDPQHQ